MDFPPVYQIINSTRPALRERVNRATISSSSSWEHIHMQPKLSGLTISDNPTPTVMSTSNSKPSLQTAADVGTKTCACKPTNAVNSKGQYMSPAVVALQATQAVSHSLRNRSQNKSHPPPPPPPPSISSSAHELSCSQIKLVQDTEKTARHIYIEKYTTECTSWQ